MQIYFIMYEAKTRNNYE